MKTASKSRALVAMAILAMLVGGNVAAGQQSDEAAVALQRAIRVELVDGDLTTAIGMYEDIVSRYATDRVVAAQALLRLGDSHKKLGDDLASVAYERVLSEYGDQADGKHDQLMEDCALYAELSPELLDDVTPQDASQRELER